MATPFLIVMSGLPGSGKSLIAEKIAVSLNIPIFSVDPIESAIIKSGIVRSFKTGLAAYFVASTLAEEQLKLGNSAVVDAVNAEDEGKKIWHDLSSKLNTPLLVIECVNSDMKLHKQRIEARHKNLYGIEEISWNKVEARRKKYTDWKIKTLTLDTSEDLEQNVQKALEFIKTFRR